MTRSACDPWLNRFAIATATATLLLIGIGGLVTSHEAGLAVPDWPTTYGYNLFLFPPSNWIGGIFYEHTHRLFASLVGLLTTVLAVWLWIKEARRWVRWLGVAAFFGVVGQGVLGGLRVTLLQNQLGFVHATFAHLFLVLVSLIALVTSRGWAQMTAIETRWPVSTALRFLLVSATSMVLLQLILGATMRHQHAGLAVPDFPLAYGKFWPGMDAASVEAINRNRMDVFDPNPITAFQIGLHMVHRIGALVTLALIGLCVWSARVQLGARAGLSKLSLLWLALIFLQAALGAATVLSNKAADMATAHVIVGAASLVVGAILSLIGFRFSGGARNSVSAAPDKRLLAASATRPTAALTIS